MRRYQDKLLIQAVMSRHICAGQSERHDRRRYRHEDKRFHKRAGAKKLHNRRDKRGRVLADFKNSKRPLSFGFRHNSGQ